MTTPSELRLLERDDQLVVEALEGHEILAVSAMGAPAGQRDRGTVHRIEPGETAELHRILLTSVEAMGIEDVLNQMGRQLELLAASKGMALGSCQIKFAVWKPAPLGVAAVLVGPKP